MMNELNPYKNKLDGLKGLLIVPFVMLGYSIISHVQFLQDGIYFLIKSGLWQSLTTPGSDIYQSFWAPYLILESVAGITLVATSVIAVWLFARRHRYLPRVMIGLYVYAVIFATIDFIAAYILVSPVAKGLYEVMVHPMINQLLVESIFATIGTPYFILSKRVKKTFTC